MEYGSINCLYKTGQSMRKTIGKTWVIHMYHTYDMCTSRIHHNFESQNIVGYRYNTVHPDMIWHIRHMKTSTNGTIFLVTGPLWWESSGHRWVPLTKASDVELYVFHLRAVIWHAIALIMSLWCSNHVRDWKKWIKSHNSTLKRAKCGCLLWV